MGGAVIFERLVQFVIPLVLVRVFDVDEFGHYKLFWLLVNTAILFAPLGMPSSLMFFLPRSEDVKCKALVLQTALVLLVTGSIAAVLVSPLSPLRPGTIIGTPVDGYAISVFTVIWLLGSMIDTLPSAHQDVRRQVGAIIFVATLRLLLVAGVAYLTRDLGWVIIALLVLSLIKLSMVLNYIVRRYGWVIPKINIGSIRRQLNYALPFGLSGGLYNMRVQAEQWVVALLFKADTFAVFSVAVSLVPLVGVLRRPIHQVMLPKMSHAQVNDDVPKVIELNNKGNIAVSSALFPVLAFLFVYAESIIEVLFTNAYSDATGVLRIYIMSMLLLGIEISTVLIVFSQGNFVMKLSAGLILASVSLSYLGARLYGLQGAVLGSVVCMYIGTMLSYGRACALTGYTFRNIQDWKGLLLLAVYAISSVFGSREIMFWMYAEEEYTFLRLVMSGMVFVALYFVLIVTVGKERILKRYLGGFK